MSRFVVLVLDGFGVGAMEDAAEYRAADANANTCLHVLEYNPNLQLPNMQRLGLMNIIGQEKNGMLFSDFATYGKSKLKHYGADTFFGHQEIMGTDPVRGTLQTFTSVFDKVARALTEKGYQVREYKLGNGAKVMGINDAAMVSDNPANDPGQVFNVIGLASVTTFEEILKMSKIIREQVQVTRVIAHACDEITYKELEGCIEELGPGLGSVNPIKLDFYKKNVKIRHLGYGVDETGQTPYLLGKYGVPVTHLGKFADLVPNPYGQKFSCVDTGELLRLFRDALKNQTNGLIAANVQETDLSGHEKDPVKYARILSMVDEALGTILQMLGPEDIMVIMADHGNDPTNGTFYHSREYTPLMVYGEGIPAGNLGVRETMSDVGATVLDYFQRDKAYKDSGLREVKTQNGTSFLDLLRPGLD